MTLHTNTVTARAARLAIVLSHPTQYYSPWFRWLSENTSLKIRVFYLWNAGATPTHDPGFDRTIAWDVDLLCGYDHEFVPNSSSHPTSERFSGLHNPGLTRRLDAWKPDAILLFGYAYASHMIVILWNWFRRVPLLFRGDSHLLGRPPHRGLRGLAMRTLFARFAGVTYVGKANRDYFKAFGVPESRLFFAPHAVNSRHFSPELSTHQQRARALRGRLGISPDATLVLFAGKLVPWKQPRLLLDAFLELAPANTVLLYVGDGPEKSALQAQAAAFDAAGVSVHFLPFANQSEMPACYLAASLFVLPSNGIHESWGLAVNEAMEMGTPCLVSDRVGCQQDLVSDGETGWVFPSEEPAALGTTLARALDDLHSRGAGIRRAVRQRIRRYSYEHAAAGLQLALESALAR